MRPQQLFKSITPLILAMPLLAVGLLLCQHHSRQAEPAPTKSVRQVSQEPWQLQGFLQEVSSPLSSPQWAAQSPPLSLSSRRSNMALNAAGYTAAGAGTTAANGNYVPVTGAYAAFNGATQYFNGTYYLGYYFGWNISTDPNHSGGFSLYSDGGSGTTTSFLLTGWIAPSSGGTAPAPTFSPIGGAAPAAAPRLQPRVVIF